MSAFKKKAAASLVWFEITAEDLDRAKRFYGALFGWRIAPFPGMAAPEAQNYLHIDTAGPDDSPDGGLMKRMHPQQPITTYIGVPSVTECMGKVEKPGGEVCIGKTTLTITGYFAICRDTEGHTFALWEKNEKSE